MSDPVARAVKLRKSLLSNHGCCQGEAGAGARVLMKSARPRKARQQKESNIDKQNNNKKVGEGTKCPTIMVTFQESAITGRLDLVMLTSFGVCVRVSVCV